MDFEGLIVRLESEWVPDAGFFWQIRQGEFEQSDFERALLIISSIPTFPDQATIPKRLVSLIWYIPVFMTWQVERITKSGGNLTDYNRAVAKMRNEVERILGVP